MNKQDNRNLIEIVTEYLKVFLIGFAIGTIIAIIYFLNKQNK